MQQSEMIFGTTLSCILSQIRSYTKNSVQLSGGAEPFSQWVEVQKVVIWLDSQLNHLCGYPVENGILLMAPFLQGKLRWGDVF